MNARMILIQKPSGSLKIFDQSIWPSNTPATIRIIAAQKVEVIGSPSVKYAQVVVESGMKLLKSMTSLVRQWRSAEFQSAYGTTPPNKMQSACTPRCGASTTNPWAAMISTKPNGSSQTPDIHMECAATSTPGICRLKKRACQL